MGLNDKGGRGATGDTGSQWDQIFSLKSRLRKTMTRASVWKGETEPGSCAVELLGGSRECL